MKRVLVVDDDRLVAWVVEASLHARVNGSAPLRELIESPGLFPFRLRPINAKSLCEISSKIEILHHYLDEEYVCLKRDDV